MSKKIVYQREEIDHLTGQVTKQTFEYKINKNNLRFGMFNMESLEWLKKFESLTQMKILFMLLEYESHKTGLVIINSSVKKELGDFLGLNLRAITAAISSLVENDCLVRVKRGEYMINPNIIYQGGTAKWNEKFDKYNEYKYQQTL